LSYRPRQSSPQLSAYAKEKHEEARQNLGLAAIDFSIPDDREALRQEARQLKAKKKGLLGFLGL
jgi:hypothetical protein